VIVTDRKPKLAFLTLKSWWITMEKEHCDASETLKKAGLAKTSQRMAVLQDLILAERPLNAHEIFKKTQSDFHRHSLEAKINRVTVYRILSSFRESGIVREIETGHGTSYYEMACVHNPVHPHFRCRHCGRIVCLPPLTLSQAWDWLAQPSNFSVERIDIQLIGLCAQCKQAENSNTVASASNGE
jgi:Fe2+ or Zn2+ uptake regulation protein